MSCLDGQAFKYFQNKDRTILKLSNFTDHVSDDHPYVPQCEGCMEGHCKGNNKLKFFTN